MQIDEKNSDLEKQMGAKSYLTLDLLKAFFNSVTI